MTLSQQTKLELMAYADGELEPGAAKQIEALIAANAEAKGFLDAIAVLGEVVRHVSADMRERPEADGIADAVMAEILAGGLHGKPRRDVVPAGLTAVPALHNVVARRRLGASGAIFVGALALAAGIFVYVNTRSPGPLHRQATAIASPSGEMPAGSTAVGAGGALAEQRERPAPVPTARGQGVDLESVDAPEPNVSVFSVPSKGEENSATSIVVWIRDDSKRTGSH